LRKEDGSRYKGKKRARQFDQGPGGPKKAHRKYMINEKKTKKVRKGLSAGKKDAKKSVTSE